MDKSLSGYWRLMLAKKDGNNNESILLVDDPACEDYYDEDIASGMFEDWIDNNFDDRDLNIIGKAIEDGYDVTTAPNEPHELVCECEEFKFNGYYDRCEQCDLNGCGNSQSYTFEGNTCSGDIWQYDSAEDFYPIDGNGNPDFDNTVKGYDLEDGREYAYIFDHAVSEDGCNVALYDVYIED